MSLIHIDKVKSNLASDILTLVTGTTIAQVFSICASPFLTRLYGPEAFGLFALFSSITSIMSTIACMRYENAILLPNSDEEASNVFGLSVIFAITISIVSIPFLILLQYPLIKFLKTPDLEPFFWLIPLAIMVSGILLALNYWNTRISDFSRLASARVTNSGSVVGIQLGGGFLGYASGGFLISASISGLLISTIILGMQTLLVHFSFFKKHISWKKMFESLKRYSKFPKYDLLSAVLNVISWQIPIFLLSFFFSTTVVGYYSLGMMIIQLPMSLIGSAIAQVFFNRAIKARLDGNLDTLVEKVFKILVIIGFFPILMLTIIGSDIFTIFFGERWAETGIYLQILSIWAFVWFISSPLSTLWIVLEKQEFGLIVTTLNFITRFVSLIAGGIYGNVYLSLTLFALSGIAVYGYLLITLMKYVGVQWADLKIFLSSIIIKFLPVSVLLISLKLFHIPSLVIVGCAISTLLIYYRYSIRREPDFKFFIQQFSRKKD